MKYIVLIVLIIMNMRSFVLMGVDKKKSIKGTYRISEKKLLWSALAFGSLGFILGMKHFHHKTLKPRFIWTGRCSLVLHLGLLSTGLYFIYLRPWLTSI